MSMREMFPQFYLPTDDEAQELWDNAEFAFDANVLLNLYRYTPTTRNQLLESIAQLRNRWLPYQAAHEFQRNRLQVIDDTRSAYQTVSKQLKKVMNQLRDAVNKRTKLHPVLSAVEFSDVIDACEREVLQRLEDAESKHRDIMGITGVRGADHIRERVDEVFAGCFGEQLPNEVLEDLCKRGEERYERGIPPGYKDRKKPSPEKFGDLIIWWELLERAKESRLPVVFVTADQKEDWWEIFKGNLIGPRQELVVEMHREAGTSYFMFTDREFIRLAKQVRESAISDDTVVEVSRMNDSIFSLQRERPKLAEGDRAMVLKILQHIEDENLVTNDQGQLDLEEVNLDFHDGLHRLVEQISEVTGLTTDELVLVNDRHKETSEAGSDTSFD